ncbi:recombinase family protein [Metaclostridioides mangenotii]|uniref:DNA invertase Pin-like site-specific DNA recombinase n=1 Tax=Metaclostridioides mangenotii TaxID=1540 RepID=A0ABS4E6W0_9FIRM|nr:recombinase family protein [Clostridioides mangenotii]MBP1853680.1 DNA invertase Pin-like site-specific DNA recombinase [Clostridioides mangenotii]
MNVAIYLRKSRADLEAEQIGEFETLAKHKATLIKVAKDKNLNIVNIKEEIVSGESITARPKMIELLNEVEDGKYDAVLVVDIDRLGRGNMKDQGVILEAFKNSNTKIITPQKTYDLDDELDEQMTEFQTFIARQELKTIKKRMLRGRKKSFEDGKFIYSTPPFGYDAIYNKNGERAIVPNQDSEIVKLIYNLYINEEFGSGYIAKYLDSLNIKPERSNNWSPVTIRKILSNKTYCGYLSYGRTVQTKKINENGNLIHKRNNKNDIEYAKGRHQAIISEDIYNNAQRIMSSKSKITNPGGIYSVQNPFAGIMRCKKCRSILKRNANNGGKIYLKCRNECGNRSTQLEFVEEKILSYLNDILESYKIKIDKKEIKNRDLNDPAKTTKQILVKLETELKDLETQRNNLYDYFERKIYDEDTFIERSNSIKDRTEKVKQAIVDVNSKIPKNKKSDAEIMEGIKNVLEVYPYAKNAKEKNKLLKSIVQEIEYYKEDSYETDQFDAYIKLKLNN